MDLGFIQSTDWSNHGNGSWKRSSFSDQSLLCCNYDRHRCTIDPLFLQITLITLHWSNEATVFKSQQFHFYCDVSNTIGIIVTNLWHEAFRDDSFGVLMTFDHAPITGEGFFFFFICQKKIIFFSLFLLPWSNIYIFSYSLPPFTSSFL